MLFLQDVTAATEPQIPIIPPDSAKQLVQSVINQAVEDPHTFWHTVLMKMTDFGLKVVAAIVIYLIGMWLIGYVKKVLRRIFERKKTERTLATFITSLVTILLTVMLVIATIGTLGVDTSSFAALLTAGGMAIGMALSGTVQNFAGGVMLLIFRPFKSGDYIIAQGEEGTVMDVSIVSTKILTVANRVVILPNGALFTGNIVNVSAQGLQRAEWKVSVSYGADAARFRQVVLTMLLEDKRILTSKDKRPLITDRSAVKVDPATPIPDPTVALSSLNENDITFTIRAWALQGDFWPVYNDMNERFYTELPQHGFSFAYPHMDVTILSNS